MPTTSRRSAAHRAKAATAPVTPADAEAQGGPVPGAPRKPAGTVRRALYDALGFLCVGLAIIGVFVPVWPTTVFAIAASILFAKANPGAYRWLLRSRLLGPYLRNWHEKTGITLPYKIRTCVILWVGLALSIVFFVDALWLRALLVAIGVAVTWHVFAIKTRKD